MLQGYELWLTDGEGRRAFRPAAAQNVADVLAEARQLLAADPDMRQVAIEIAGRRLATVESGAPAATA